MARLVSASRYNRRRLAGSVPAASRLAGFRNTGLNDVWRRCNVSLGLGINIFDIHCDFGSYLFEKLAHWIYIAARLIRLKSAVWYPFELDAREHAIKNRKNTSKFVFFTIIVRPYGLGRRSA